MKIREFILLLLLLVSVGGWVHAAERPHLFWLNDRGELFEYDVKRATSTKITSLPKQMADEISSVARVIHGRAMAISRLRSNLSVNPYGQVVLKQHQNVYEFWDLNKISSISYVAPGLGDPLVGVLLSDKKDAYFLARHDDQGKNETRAKNFELTEVGFDGMLKRELIKKRFDCPCPADICMDINCAVQVSIFHSDAGDVFGLKRIDGAQVHVYGVAHELYFLKQSAWNHHPLPLDMDLIDVSPDGTEVILADDGLRCDDATPQPCGGGTLVVVMDRWKQDYLAIRKLRSSNDMDDPVATNPKTTQTFLEFVDKLNRQGYKAYKTKVIFQMEGTKLRSVKARFSPSGRKIAQEIDKYNESEGSDKPVRIWVHKDTGEKLKDIPVQGEVLAGWLDDDTLVLWKEGRISFLDTATYSTKDIVNPDIFLVYLVR